MKLTKSKSLKFFSAILVSICLFSACKHKNKAPEKKVSVRPNIIFIMSDDHTTQAITAYNKRYANYFSTPNIDKLANEGVRFDNVFCTNALCGPSRATILTGKYSHQNHFYKNRKGGKFNANQWTFPKALHNNGYQTAIIGKWHLGSEPQGFDYYMYHDNPGQQGTYWDPIYNQNGKYVQIKGYATNITADTAIAWIDRVKNKNQPFALLLHFKAPHREWTPDKKYTNMYPHTDMPYPKTYHDDYKTREQTMGNTEMTMDYFNRKDLKFTPPEGLTKEELTKWGYYEGEKNHPIMPEGCKTLQEARNWKYQRFIKDYLACIKSVDDNVGKLLDFLKDNHLDKNTLIIYTGDQGFYLGDHGLFDKRFIYDTSMRMPFIMRYPDKIKAGSTNQNLISNIDFAPTLLDYANVEIPSEVQGRSIKPLINNHIEVKQDDKVYYHYYEYPLWHHVQPHYGMRTPKYKIAHFYYDIDVWEMYDLENDPDEMNNLMLDANYTELAEKLKKELAQLRIEVGDTASLKIFREMTDKDLGNINY